jgi:hypothetical protein
MVSYFSAFGWGNKSIITTKIMARYFKCFSRKNHIYCTVHKKIPAWQCRLLPVKCVTHVDFGGWGGYLWVGVRTKKGLWGKGSWFSAWIQWEGKSTSLHKRLPPQVKDFFVFVATNVWIICCICCKYVFCAIPTFLLCRLTISHVTEIQNMRLLLGRLA